MCLQSPLHGKPQPGDAGIGGRSDANATWFEHTDTLAVHSRSATRPDGPRFWVEPLDAYLIAVVFDLSS